MARVGQEQHSRLMQELKSISADAVHNYQLLGTQMQLAILLERSTTSG